VGHACENCKVSLTNEMGCISEIMCDRVDKSFNYDVLLFVVFLEKLVVYFFKLLLGCFETMAVCVYCLE
jgi:hypothetical protein